MGNLGHKVTESRTASFQGLISDERGLALEESLGLQGNILPTAHVVRRWLRKAACGLAILSYTRRLANCPTNEFTYFVKIVQIMSVKKWN